MDATARLAWLGKKIREKRFAPRSATPTRATPTPAEPRAPAPAPAPAPAVLRYGRHRPRRADATVGAARTVVTLEDATDGGEVEVPGAGRAYVLEAREEIDVPVDRSVDPGLLFFDIEAAGLTAAPLFLIGVMRVVDRTATVRQFLARTYAEEAAVISLFLRAATDAEAIVSYNGKSYDLPYIRTRAAQHRLDWSREWDANLPHLDLIHPSRRRWKEELPNCRLQTLETLVLGKPRIPDIPGRDIPDAYHAFVRTGDAGDMVRILVHNRRDLVSLAEVLERLEEPVTEKLGT